MREKAYLAWDAHIRGMSYKPWPGTRDAFMSGRMSKLGSTSNE